MTKVHTALGINPKQVDGSEETPSVPQVRCPGSAWVWRNCATKSGPRASRGALVSGVESGSGAGAIPSICLTRPKSTQDDGDYQEVYSLHSQCKGLFAWITPKTEALVDSADPG